MPRGRHHPGDIEHRLQVGHRVAGAVAIGLVDDEHVGDLHQARLVGLDGVAPARVDHDDGRVGGVDDVGLHLAHPDRFDHDPVTTGRAQNGHGIVGRTGEPGHPPDPGSAPPADYLGSFTSRGSENDSTDGPGDGRADTPAHDTAEVH